MWIATEDELGRMYYYEEESGHTCWELPRWCQKGEAHEATVRAAMKVCVSIGTHNRLRMCFIVWQTNTRLDCTGHVRRLVPMFESWQRIRSDAVHRTARMLQLEDRVGDFEIMLGSMASELANCRALHAEAEYSLLVEKTRSNASRTSR